MTSVALFVLWIIVTLAAVMNDRESPANVPRTGTTTKDIITVSSDSALYKHDLNNQELVTPAIKITKPSDVADGARHLSDGAGHLSDESTTKTTRGQVDTSVLVYHPLRRAKSNLGNDDKERCYNSIMINE